MDPQDDESNDNQAQRDAAERVVRDQLDAIYHKQPHVNVPQRGDEHLHHKHHKQHHQPQNHTQPSAPFEANPDVNPWQKYHQQWQEYYQRYYENYYVGHMHQVIQEKDKEKEEAVEAAKSPEQKKAEDVQNLREKIVDNAKEKVHKARKSRHFIPLMSAIVVVIVVAFLQYNQIIIGNVEAYVSPGTIDPQNIVVDPDSDTHVSADPRLIIPKINVDVPVIYNVALDYNAQMAAMQKGVAHFAIPGADSVPGQLGNTVFSGHSSNDLFDPGDYKFIFAQLDKLQQGDTIYVNYNSVRYTYTVTKKAVVKPSDVNALEGYTDKPYLTLITCTPLGTSLNRLLVYAEQVAPDPSKASAANSSTGNSQATIPGNSPTVLERLFGAH
jgi:sortase A